MSASENKTATQAADERFFHRTMPDPSRSGWYYQAREGVYGPFVTKESAQFDLARRIALRPERREELRSGQDDLVTNA